MNWIRVRYAREERKRDKNRRRVILRVGEQEWRLEQKEVARLYRELGKRMVKT
jgi:hypothetical protein